MIELAFWLITGWVLLRGVWICFKTLSSFILNLISSTRKDERDEFILSSDFRKVQWF